MISKFWTSASFCAILLFSACGEDPYSDLPDGSRWRLVSFGDQIDAVDAAALVYLDVVSVNSAGDTVEVLEYAPFDVGKDQLWQVLRKRFTGDSIAYVSIGRDFLHLPAYRGDTLNYAIRIGRARTAADLKDSSFLELQSLDSLARLDSLDVYREHNGMYVRSFGYTDTAAVRKGKEVVIHYSGRLLSGKVIDDTRRMNAPMRFVVGNDDQIIPGLEMALELMHRGERAEIIIPSWMGFGTKGSAGGVVPPYSTLIFDLEVVELSK